MTENINGLSELIKKLKDDGITAGKLEKQKITKSAENEATIIINKANEEKKKILDEAKREADNIKKQMKVELNMAGRDYIISLKENIKGRIVKKLINNKLKEILTDKSFLKNILKDMILNYMKKSTENVIFEVSDKLKKDLEVYFKAELYTYLINGKIEGKEDLLGLKIIKKDENLIWDFSIDSVTMEFMKLLDSNLSEYLIDQ